HTARSLAIAGLLHLSIVTPNNPPPPNISTLSLHDALPISRRCRSTCAGRRSASGAAPGRTRQRRASRGGSPSAALRLRPGRSPRSEEHTSELQSRENLVCRLLLEKKKRS